MPVILMEAPKDVGIGIRKALFQDFPRILEIERLAFGGQWDYYQFKASLDDVFLVAVDAATAEIVGFLVLSMRGTKRSVIHRQRCRFATLQRNSSSFTGGSAQRRRESALQGSDQALM